MKKKRNGINVRTQKQSYLIYRHMKSQPNNAFFLSGDRSFGYRAEGGAGLTEKREKVVKGKGGEGTREKQQRNYHSARYPKPLECRYLHE